VGTLPVNGDIEDSIANSISNYIGRPWTLGNPSQNHGVSLVRNRKVLLPLERQDKSSLKSPAAVLTRKNIPI
jgi:hypothetical protein